MPTTDQDLDIALARALGWRCEKYAYGWRIISPNDCRGAGRGFEEAAWALDGPRFSRDWAGLVLLVEAMRQREWWYVLRVYVTGSLYAEFYQPINFRRPESVIHRAEGFDAPKATALAAARALGLAVEE